MRNVISPNTDPFALAEELSGRHLIDGKLVPAVSGKTFDVVYPATGAVIGQAAYGEVPDVEAAVAAAKRAQKEWGRISARQRGKLVAQCAELLGEHVEELARLVTLETGKALRTESRIEASVLADTFVFFGGLGSELKGESVPFNPDMMTVTVRQPIGVVGAIIPWNVPLLLMALKIAPAMVAGNAVVVKPAEEAPFAALRAAQIMNQALPPGVLNIVTGYGPECGGPLAAHPDVRKVSFTGSVETGKIIAKTAAEKLAPVTLELGGKSPMIIMGDADLDKAVAGAITGMRFTRQGQSCTAASRMYVHADVHDAFVDRLKEKVDAMTLGDPLDEGTDIGTIISPQQFAKVQHYLKIGEETPGMRMLRCAAMPSDPKLAGGLFVQPVLCTDVPAESPLAREEIFGPVTCIFRFTELEDALTAANDSEYGLAATIWTSDLKAGLQGAHRLEAGFVQVNQNLVVMPGLSYGGIKHSGYGKEASLEAMLEHFTHKKTIIVNMA